MISITETLEILNNMKEGKINQFALQKFTIDRTTTKALIQGIPIGNYIQLTNSKLYESVIMSTTPMEVRTNYKIITEAYGDVLIAGLGLGLIVLPIQSKDSVTSVTILEKHPEIIQLVAPQLPLNSKVKIIEGDIFKYTFPLVQKFDTIYFDIWNYINNDIYKEMQKLKRKYKKHKKPTSLMSCWAEYNAKNNIRLI